MYIYECLFVKYLYKTSQKIYIKSIYRYIYAIYIYIIYIYNTYIYIYIYIYIYY